MEITEELKQIDEKIKELEELKLEKLTNFLKLYTGKFVKNNRVYEYEDDEYYICISRKYVEVTNKYDYEKYYAYDNEKYSLKIRKILGLEYIKFWS